MDKHEVLTTTVIRHSIMPTGHDIKIVLSFFPVTVITVAQREDLHVFDYPNKLSIPLLLKYYYFL